MVLVASKNSGITSFKQLVDQSKAGKQFSYGSIGIGSLGHLAMARLAKQAGFDWNHIPYRRWRPFNARCSWRSSAAGYWLRVFGQIHTSIVVV